MLEKPTLISNHSTPSTEHNVHGLERAGSLAGGALMLAKGVRRGGVVGILQAVVGGLALVRGVRGQCATKAWLQRHRSELDSLRGDVERGAADLALLKASADAATRTATVTGNTSLNTPKL
ncbi:hypothetical protein PS627_02537 [Pseudomonas fluorescens]|uniref:YgaP-like transmembrane domain n=1 Tax=Pseudomonas fluorescens TaxID=294 RepID=UPI00125B9215|nr:YgaP-like transmembrane domain [Pseudomonas fluorescens]CAG8867533.1 hypothetical protein PS627_02537 [Pseudomonas fluorescens]VVP91927.1 hypothetical protein PS910_02958 [Pseudomonas fluorescens]